MENPQWQTRHGSPHRKLRNHISNHIQKAERTNWKPGEAVSSQSLCPVTYSLQQDSMNSPNNIISQGPNVLICEPGLVWFPPCVLPSLEDVSQL